jgi:hypothetical protein
MVTQRSTPAGLQGMDNGIGHAVSLFRAIVDSTWDCAFLPLQASQLVLTFKDSTVISSEFMFFKIDIKTAYF